MAKGRLAQAAVLWLSYSYRLAPLPQGPEGRLLLTVLASPEVGCSWLAPQACCCAAAAPHEQPLPC